MIGCHINFGGAGVVRCVCQSSEGEDILKHLVKVAESDRSVLVLPGKLRSLLDLFIGGVRHNARKLHDVLAGVFEDGAYLVINAVSFDASAAVCQQDGTGILRETGKVLLYASLSEIDFCGILKNKVVHFLRK